MSQLKDSKNQIRWFDFTLWKNSEGYNEVKHEEVAKVLDTFCEKYCFQLEKAPTTDRLHYQGRAFLGTALTDRKRLSAIRKLLPPEICGPVGDNISCTSLATTKDSKKWAYVAKAETRIEGPFHKGLTRKDWDPSYDARDKLIRIWPDQFFPWQKEVMNSVLNPPKNYEDTINVIIDTEGGEGKSSLILYLRIKHENICKCLMYTMSVDRMNEEVHAYYASKSEESRVDDVVTILIDLPRAIKPKEMDQFYIGLEQLKSNFVCERRYKFQDLAFAIPQIWIFTNKQPKYDVFSLRRWRLWQVDSARNLVPYESPKFIAYKNRCLMRTKKRSNINYSSIVQEYDPDDEPENK